MVDGSKDDLGDVFVRGAVFALGAAAVGGLLKLFFGGDEEKKPQMMLLVPVDQADTRGEDNEQGEDE